jgi:soluble lytic murein transglycosylase
VPWTFAPQPVWGEPGFLRAVELARMGFGTEARRELSKLGLGGGKGSSAKAVGGTEVLWLTAVLLDRGHLWHASHSVPRYTLTGFRRRYPNDARSEAEWHIGYPRAFPEAVERNGKANKVPDALQWAIMREESAFYPRAESFANALGLTQMMQGTAKRFAKWPVTREALFDPDKNLEIGSKFLGFLLEHFGGAVPLSISGYNAGEGAVDRWLKERGQLELDEFIETIPFDETRGYTKRVLSTYFTYNWLYGREKPIPVLAFSLKKAPGATNKGATGKSNPAGKNIKATAAKKPATVAKAKKK